MIIIKKFIYYSLLLIFIIIFIYSCININRQNNDLKNKIILNNYYSNFSKNDYNINYYRNKFNNNDIVGIINIDSLNISNLILKGRNNSYYLNHLENKIANIYGSIMLDYRTDLSNDSINIIYGNTSNSYVTPFNKLLKYLDYDFYKDNKIIEIMDEYSIYKYEIFSVAKVNKNNYKHLYVNLDNYEHLEQLKCFKNISIYKENIILNNNDKVLILETYLNNSKQYILVIAKLIKYMYKQL